MKVKFNLLKDDLSWVSSIHQLNDDVLMRHVLVKGNLDDMGVTFSYCESSESGHIMNSNNDLVGCFKVFH